jgi:peptide/nickel transport system substrate-binding protein
MLAGLGVGASGMAGCQAIRDSSDATGTPEDATTPTDPGETPTEATTTEPISGGWPNVGGTQAPESLNPLTGTHRLIERTLFSFGTWLHPQTLEPVPAAFDDWELTVSNVGTASPTLVGHLRDDMTFTDGTPVTAEDAKFTIDYIKQQGVTGRFSATKFDSVESITVDDPKGTTVNYFFSQKDADWFQNILGQILLPKHIWKDVADYQQYTPRTTSEGVVGAGPFKLTRFDWENWFELGLRDEGDRWETAAAYTDWFHESAPFIDGVRFEVFGGEDSLRQAVFDGDIDAGFRSVPIDVAVKAAQHEELEVKQLPSAGWDNHSYNLRRRPLDDRIFRQFLVLTVDKKWIVEDLNRGIGAEEGTYATPKSYSDWRPPAPDEQSAYQGIPTPSLAFPGQRGSFSIDADGIETARQFLSESAESTYEYT